jgi:hypothetical protein
MTDSLRGMRSMRNRGGVVFDIFEDSYERFMDVFVHLKDSDSRIDFVIQKCAELPDLSEEGGFEEGGQSGWRGGNGGGNDGGYSSGGGYKHQRNPSFGNGSNYNRGGDSNTRGGHSGGGNWHNRQNSDNGGGWNSKGKDWRNDNASSGGAPTTTWDNSHAATTSDWRGGAGGAEDTTPAYASKFNNQGNAKYGVPSGNSSKSSYCYSTPGSTLSTPNPYNGDGPKASYTRAPQQQSNLDATVYVKNLSF